MVTKQGPGVGIVNEQALEWVWSVNKALEWVWSINRALEWV